MPTYKLFYVNARGRAEIVRLTFAQADVEYEDIRFGREEWPKYKLGKEGRDLSQYKDHFPDIDIPIIKMRRSTVFMIGSCTDKTASLYQEAPHAT